MRPDDARGPLVGDSRTTALRSRSQSRARQKLLRPPAVSASWRVWYRFEDNSLLAHAWWDGVWIRPGDFSFLKVVFGNWWRRWTLFGKENGQSVSYPGPKSLLHFPAPGGLCKVRCTLAITMTVLRCPQQVVLELNGKPLPPLVCRAGDQTYRLAVPATLVKTGENQLRFRFQRYARRRKQSAGAAISQIRLISDSADWRGRGEHFYVMIPKGSRLRVRFGRSSRFSITLTDSSGHRVRLLTRSGGAREGHAERIVALTGPTDVYRIEFVSDGAWRERVIEGVVPKALPKPKIATRNVILWVVDTLRADRFALYNPRTRVRTPNYTATFKKGTFLRWATAAASYSLASHASILTGMTPAGHGTMSTETGKVKKRTLMVQEVLKRAGFTTAAFLSNGYVSNKWGFQRGWSHFRNFIRERRASHSKNLFVQLEKWITQNQKKRFFAYVVTVDPHVAYVYREAFTKQYWPGRYRGPVSRYVTGGFLDDIRAGRVRLKPVDKRRLEALYDGEVSYNDYYFGQLVKLLARVGLSRSTMVIVSSDHGEEFFEHGSVGHARSLYQELIDVPLMFYQPGVVPVREPIDADAEHLDIFPTICDFVRVDCPAQLQGRSLLPSMFEIGWPVPGAAFASRGVSAKSLKQRQWKYILFRDGSDALFHLTRDPKEQQNLGSRQPIVRRWARDMMGFWLPHERHWHKSNWGSPGNHGLGLRQFLVEKYRGQR